MKITLPGTQTLEYIRGSSLSSEIISCFAALTQASGSIEDGPSAMVVVEDAADLAGVTAQAGEPNASNAISADLEASSTEKTPTATPAVAPGSPLIPDPLEERWEQPNVQMFHRVPGKGLCSHVFQTEKASTESNTRFRVAQVSEECLICGQPIHPRTELGIREHYKQHRERLSSLEAQ